MSFDESLFSFFYKRRRRKKAEILEQKKKDANAVILEDVKEQLSFFSSAVFLAPMEIRSTSGVGYLSSNKIFLPSYVAALPTKEENFSFYKILILHLYGSYLLFSKTNENVSGLSDFESWKKILAIKESIKETLSNIYPNYSALLNSINTLENSDNFHLKTSEDFSALLTIEFGFSLLGLFGLCPKEMTIIKAENDLPELRQALPDAKTELKNQNTHQVKKINLDENKENIGQDVFHHFEKLETLEEFKGIQREMDGGDELDMHADALDELNLEDVIRSGKAAQSLYKTELDMGFEIADFEQSEISSGLKEFSYDEWDYQRRNYKKNWCSVFEDNYKKQEKKPSVNDEDIVLKKSFSEKLRERKSEVESIRKKLLRVSSQYIKRKKLYDGRFVDIDNFIRNFTLLSRNISSDGRNYLDVFKKNRDLSILILVDNSLSADSWVQNARVLDLSLESLLIFGEAIEKFSDPVMVAGFSSNTRSSCKFTVWKNFDGSWDDFKELADEITPEGYTRIGPAIRHARTKLLERKEKKRVLLILTDGRPTDYDRYEGVYGLSDVRKSIEECERDGIIAFAIAVDPSAKQYLPKLFGAGNFSILLNINKLPEILSLLYIKISKK